MILVTDQMGKQTARGTGCLISYRGQNYLLTAYHVADKLPDSGAQLCVLHPNGALPIAGKILFGSEEDDFALLAPPSLPGSISFLDIDEHPAVEEAIQENKELPILVYGFPNIAHDTNESLKLQKNGAVSLPTYYPEEPPSNGHQLNFELDLSGPCEGGGPEARRIQERLQAALDGHSTVESEFGGMSGGPIVLLTEERPHLVAIVSNGGVLCGGLPLVRGVRIRAVIDELTHALGPLNE